MAQCVNDLAFLCGIAGLIPGLVQWVNYPMLLLLWHGSQMSLRFKPLAWELHMLPLWPKKEGKKDDFKNALPGSQLPHLYSGTVISNCLSLRLIARFR